MPYGMKPKKLVCENGWVKVTDVDPVTRKPRTRMKKCPKCQGKGCEKK